MRRVLALLFVVASVVACGGVTACGGRDGGPRAAADAVPTTAESESTASAIPTPEPTTVAPAVPTTRPSPTRTPIRRPSPSRKPVPRQPGPPPPAPPAPGCTGPKYVGTAATRAQVRDALKAAADKIYWPVSAPQIKIPVELVKAVAWQESGWQSNIVACDTGVGLMQVQPPTARFVNTRFEKSYDINKYMDNAILGVNYLAWLTKYFGDLYFDSSFDLSARDPDNPVLLDAVIAAYNVGFGHVDTAAGLVIPNRQYVNNVEALMTTCVCLTY